MVSYKRDKFGLDTIYQMQSKNIVVDEYKKLFDIDGFKPVINDYTVSDYMRYGYSPDLGSLLLGVIQLTPATELNSNGRYYEIKDRYWKPEMVKKQYHNIDINQWVNLYWDELTDRIKNELNDKVCMTLSGGIDSSLVASALKSVDKGLFTKAYSLEYGNYDELEIAQKVADYIGVKLIVVKFETDKVISELDNLQRIYDEPLIKHTFIPTYYLAKEASKEYKTIYTGDGGDELFIGYRPDYWQDPLLLRLFSRLGVLKHLIRIFGKEILRVSANNTGNKYASLVHELLLRKDATDSKWTKRVASRIFQPYFSNEEIREYSNIINNSDYFNWRLHFIDGDRITKTSYAMIESPLPVDAIRLGKTSKHFGIEYRSPMLYDKMVELALSIPVSIRYQQNTTKYFLKYLIRSKKILPECVINNNKYGLNAPIFSWLNDVRYKDYFLELLNKGVKIMGLNKDIIKDVFPPKTYNQSLKAWNLVGLSLWCKYIFER